MTATAIEPLTPEWHEARRRGQPIVDELAAAAPPVPAHYCRLHTYPRRG